MLEFLYACMKIYTENFKKKHDDVWHKLMNNIIQIERQIDVCGGGDINSAQITRHGNDND